MKKTHMSDKLIHAAVFDIENAIAVMEDILLKINTGNADMNLFIITVHGLKNALANIGEIQLSKLAVKLESDGNNNDTAAIESKTPEFIKALKILIEKIKPEKSNDDFVISHDETNFLRDKLAVIKAACEKFVIKEAKNVLEEIKQGTWPKEINEILDDISVYLLRGEFAKVGSAVNKVITMFYPK